MGEKLRFDAVPSELEIEIGGADYVLREPTGDALIRWRIENRRAQKADRDSETSPLLVHLCLFQRNGDGKDHQVPLATIRSWPARIQEKLAAKALELTGLWDEEKPEEIEARIQADQEKLAAIREGQTAKN